MYRKSITPIVLFVSFFWFVTLAGCLGLNAQDSEDFALFSNVYHSIRSKYVDEVDGHTLILAAEQGMHDALMASEGEDEEGVEIEHVPFDLSERLEGEPDEELLNIFAEYMTAFAESTIATDTSAYEYPDETELTYAAINGMFTTLEDPHSRFLSEEELRDLTTTVEGSFGGLGMYVNKRKIEDIDKQYLEVISPMEGTPAYRAGIHAGDFIFSIESELTAPMSVNEAVNRLRGEPGTSVTITILRGEDITFIRTITRELIEVPTITQRLISAEELSEVLGTEVADPLGYIRLILFTSNLSNRLEETLRMQIEQGAKGFILDLRGNAGGLLESAISTTDLFFSDGRIVSLRGRQKDLETRYEARDGQAISDAVPLVVLVNQATASASEIFAGAMKDRQRALLIGETTYGKGSVQQIYMFGESGIRLTTARYYTPSGISIDKEGIAPDQDVHIEYSPEELTSYSEFVGEGSVTTFIGAYAGSNIPNEAVESFIREAQQRYENLNENLAAQFVWSEVYRVNENESQVYDLRYDEVLRAAIPYFFHDN